MADNRPYLVAYSYSLRLKHAWRQGNKNVTCGLRMVSYKETELFKVDELNNCSMCNHVIKLRLKMNTLTSKPKPWEK